VIEERKNRDGVGGGSEVYVGGRWKEVVKGGVFAAGGVNGSGSNGIKRGGSIGGGLNENVHHQVQGENRRDSLRPPEERLKGGLNEQRVFQGLRVSMIIIQMITRRKKISE
jgi:hypothetical protein